MGYIRATYNSGSILSTTDSSELATGQEAYWQEEVGRLVEDPPGELYEVFDKVTPEGISDSLGVWDEANSKYIPDGLHDGDSSWLWLSGSSPTNQQITEWSNL